MKTKLICFCLIFFTTYILCWPQDAVAAAARGLVLWYEKILPTLLPFAILSNLFIYSNYLYMITRWIAPVIRLLFPVSENGTFVLFSGFLFGFPMGSKNCAELLKCGQLNRHEAEVLFVITNNISPVFISSYILCQQLRMPSLILPSYLILYLPPLVTGFLLLKKNSARHAGDNKKKQHSTLDDTSFNKKTASGSQMNFKIIDAGIMNGFETLTRLGGYIILFSMIASMIRLLPIPELIKIILTGITEITNGIGLLEHTALPPAIRYLLAMGFTAFGGLSGIAQTSSMIKGTGLSMKKYFLQKLFLTAVTCLLAWLYILWRPF